MKTSPYRKILGARFFHIFIFFFSGGVPPTFFYKKYKKKGNIKKKCYISKNKIKQNDMRYEYAIKLLQKLNANGAKYELVKNCSTCYDLRLVEEVKPKKKNKKNEEDNKQEPSITINSDSEDSSTNPFPEELK